MGESGPRRAIVLSGGGARGAYEVGVLDYILRTLSRQLRRELRFDIITGTSVGALNAAWIAATAEDPHRSMRLLKRLWMGLEMKPFLDLSYQSMFRLMRVLLSGAESMARSGPERRFASLLNASPIEHVLREQIPWDGIKKNLEEGFLEAVSVSTTEVDSGRTVSFMQRRGGGVPAWGGDPRKVAIPVDLNADHALASAAIPILLPAVLINNHYYCDGALRENTPMAPAMLLGADKLLIIALRKEDGTSPLAVPLQEPSYPSAFMLLGKLLNGLLLDPLEYDLARFNQYNALSEHALEDYDEDFTGKLDALLKDVRGAGLRNVDSLLVRPSEDIGRIAGKVLSDVPDTTWGKGPLAKMVKRMAHSSAGGEADLLSFLFFDGIYTRELIELGYRDAMERRDELVAFFED